MIIISFSVTVRRAFFEAFKGRKRERGREGRQGVFALPITMIYNVLTYLENSAALHPDKVAVVDSTGEFTYTTLLSACRRVGSALLMYVKRNTPVAVFAEKGANTLFAFFGTVFAGGFYCLFNPELPSSRLQDMYGVLTPGVLVTDSVHHEKARELFGDATILLIEELLSCEEDSAALSLRRQKSVDCDPLYVNFTSGSTGTPKGIAVSHRSVIDFTECFTDIFGIDEGDIIANQAPFDFDVSVKDIYSSLKTGACLVIVPRDLFSNPVGLIDFLCEHSVTVMIWAVSALCLLSTFHALDYKTPETVKKILFSGEVMPLKHLNQWREHLPNAMFVNLYGPTEITCNCTYHILESDRDYSDGIPIGISFPNEDVFLLSENDSIINSVDDVGEICVRGTCVALGYYGNEKSDRGFVQNPLHKNYGETVYRTGDLAKYGEGGELIFCGRRDFQIKYRGHRIELEEIERAMSAITGVERCCCVFDSVKSKLYGVFVGTAEQNDVADTLRKKLPAFMVPSVLHREESLPLTKNGKLDRKQILERTVIRKNAVSK